MYIPGYSGRSFAERHFSREAFRRVLRAIFPCSGDSASEVWRKLIRCLSVIVLAGCLVFFGNYYGNYRARSLQAITLDEFLGETDGDMSVPELEQAWTNIRERYPDIDFPAGMNIKYAGLYAINPDIIGKLTIPNTNIETYVMKSSGANYYYLNRDFYGKGSRYGQVFVDNRCTVSAQGNSKNILIYGHNTHDGLMFNQLEKYMTVEGYCSAPVIEFETLYGSAQYKIFAVMITNSTPDADNGQLFDYLHYDFSSDEEFAELMSQVYARSMIHTGVDLTVNDEVITLYTCYQTVFRGGRLVVFARKLRDGESPAVDLSQVYFDTKAKFPRAYLDQVDF